MRAFLIRLVILFPLCMAAWWALAVWQIEIVMTFSENLIRLIHPLARVIARPGSDSIYFNARDLSGSEVGVSMSPLALTRGLPIYVSLMLATPGFQNHWRHVIASISVICAFAFAVFMLETLIRFQEALSGQSPLSAGYVQALSKALVTRVVPIGLWCWQEREFIRRDCLRSLSKPELL